MVFTIINPESTPRSQNKKNATNSPKHQISQKADSQQNKFGEFW
jgi:hypothetical protein